MPAGRTQRHPTATRPALFHFLATVVIVLLLSCRSCKRRLKLENFKFIYLMFRLRVCVCLCLALLARCILVCSTSSLFMLVVVL